MKAEPLLSSTELMRAASCTRKALRVYQSRGLITPMTSVGNRRYDPRALDRLKLIVSLRAIDLSLDEIATVLAAKDATTGGEAARDAARGVSALLDRVSERINGLVELRKDLERARDALAACAPAPADDRPARTGESPLENSPARPLLS